MLSDGVGPAPATQDVLPLSNGDLGAALFLSQDFSDVNVRQADTEGLLNTAFLGSPSHKLPGVGCLHCSQFGLSISKTTPLYSGQLRLPGRWQHVMWLVGREMLPVEQHDF